MKKLFLVVVVFLVCGLVLFSAAESIPFKVFSYQISTRQTASQYTKADLVIDDETMSWEIVLHRKDGKASVFGTSLNL